MLINCNTNILKSPFVNHLFFCKQIVTEVIYAVTPFLFNWDVCILLP